jgi:aspartate aminotransferase
VTAYIRALEHGADRYSAVEGLPALREAICRKLSARNLIETTPTHIFVCPGATQGLSATLQALTQPGDEVLLPALHWPIYKQQAQLAGLRLRFYDLEEGYRVHPSVVGDAITDRTRIVVLNSPSNPAGHVIQADVLARILSIVHSHKDCLLISDEAYEDFIFAGTHVSTAALEKAVNPAGRRVVSIFSFSKSFGMTGYRIGYVVAPNAGAARAIQRVQEATLVALSTPVQHAGLAALCSYDSVRAHRVVLQNARAELLDQLALKSPPAGGWYALVDIQASQLTADAFADTLLTRYGVAVTPGTAFLRNHSRVNQEVGRQRYALRVALCCGSTAIRAGAIAIRKLLSETSQSNDDVNAATIAPAR